MDKTYQPHAIETSWYNTWEAENYFAPQGAGESYTIMIPPPNVTGTERRVGKEGRSRGSPNN